MREPQASVLLALLLNPAWVVPGRASSISDKSNMLIIANISTLDQSRPGSTMTTTVETVLLLAKDKGRERGGGKGNAEGWCDSRGS